MKGITDRNATIRKSYATTIAVITTVAKESTVNKLIQSLKDVYIDNEGKNVYCIYLSVTMCLTQLFIDESIRQTVGCALKGLSQCEKPDLYMASIIPLVFFATHKQTESNLHKYFNFK